MWTRIETIARVEQLRAIMDEFDLDLLVAADWSRDEIMAATVRWVSGYIAVGGPAAILIPRHGEVELLSERIGRPAAAFYADGQFPLELVSGFGAELVAERVARHGPKRIGLAEPEGFPWTFAMAIEATCPGVSFVEVTSAVQAVRLRKSPLEQQMIRTSCEIADAIGGQIPHLLRVGRSNRDVVADIDHAARLAGAESGFHLVLRMPFRGRPLQFTANPDLIEPETRYLVEISPRYEGYYSQLTLPVTTGDHDPTLERGHTDVVDAKQMAEALLKPGADLSKVAVQVEDFLRDRGHTMTSRSLGHFCGMALEEPRHDPTSPFLLAEGMTLIFHPVLADPDCYSLMRADTYLITASGAQRLNAYPC